MDCRTSSRESVSTWRRECSGLAKTLLHNKEKDSYFSCLTFKFELSSVPEGAVLASRRRFPLVHCFLGTYIVLPFVESHEDGNILHLATEMTEVLISLTKNCTSPASRLGQFGVHKKPGVRKFSYCVSETFDFCFYTLGP